MPNRSSKTRSRDRDQNVATKSVIDEIMAETEAQPGKDPLAVLLGRRGGLKGGRARANSLTAERRKEIAKKAAQTRWKEKAK